MNQIPFQQGIAKSLDALFANRLALLCGAGLSMARPSCLPGAAQLAKDAKFKYDATFGSDRPPLPTSIDDQAEFFFQRGELSTVYLTTYIDHDAFAGAPNAGHVAAADLLLTKAVTRAVSTNVDHLIESAGQLLFGQVGVGTNCAQIARLPADKAPLLKIHGCWSDPSTTIWARGQLDVEPFRTRLKECGDWLAINLLNRDILVVGFWTDWDYLNEVLETCLGKVNPSRVIVVDPCDSKEFEKKGPILYALGNRANVEFCHVRESGDQFLNKLRVDFSKAFIRKMLSTAIGAYTQLAGEGPDSAWLEPVSTDADVLWRIRRDLEGCSPTSPAKEREPYVEPLLGLTVLQLQAKGAISDGRYWLLDGKRIRVLRAANKSLHDVESAYSGEIAPAIAPDFTIAVGAEALSLPPSIARGSTNGSIARGASIKWLSRENAVAELGL